MNPDQEFSADLRRQTGSGRLVAPKVVSTGRGWSWIAEGFSLFKKNPGAWITTVILAFTITVVLSLIPLIGQLVLMLFTYPMWAGFMIGCRAQSQGEDFRVRHLFAGFAAHAGKLIGLSIIMAVASGVIMIIAMGPIYLEMLKGGFNPELAATMSDPAAFLLPLLTGMLFVLPLMMAAWFAPALIALNDVSVFRAMKLSFIGSLKNASPFLVYGLIASILFILACLPLLLGLLVLGPVLMASIFTAYQDIFIESP